MDLPISDTLSIPEHELVYSFTRSGGPGGQNVNKVESKVVLRFDVQNSPSLSDEQRWMIQQKLASRITHEGILHLSCQISRSQLANRKAVTQTFATLLQEALEIEPDRIPTRPSRASRQRRITGKKIRGGVKRQRAEQDWESEFGY
ncbi:MAG: aminoacyl-tRNA hydrolase [Candidatus Sericytochromatia bacterium]|nr:aminoacyl-tRNA hydrolase [Candidatus Sericytochromatia bacterium]